jgi:uncharacterized membrane protein
MACYVELSGFAILLSVVGFFVVFSLSPKDLEGWSSFLILTLFWNSGYFLTKVYDIRQRQLRVE